MVAQASIHCADWAIIGAGTTCATMDAGLRQHDT
jgi:hypothetical protein